MGGEAGVTRAHALLRSNKLVESSSEETEDEDEVVALNHRTARKVTAYAEPLISSPLRSSPAPTSPLSSPSPTRQRAPSQASVHLRSNGSSPRERTPQKIDSIIISLSSTDSSSPFAPMTTSRWVEKAAPAAETKIRSILKERQQARRRRAKSSSPKGRKLGRWVVEVAVKGKMEKSRKSLSKCRNDKDRKGDSRKKK
jgi:hypothetical protein